MTNLRYTLIDVFTPQPFGGNQLAVFHEGDGLETETMQKIARELNLSETVFLLRPASRKAEKRLRIFTPKMELPMAGHPTIGAAFVLAEKGLLPTAEGPNDWVLQEEVGNLPVTVSKEENRIVKAEMSQPVPVFGNPYPEPLLAAGLLSLPVEDLSESLPIRTGSAGVPFLYIPVRSLNAMKNIRFRTDVWEQHFSKNPDTQHIFVFSTETEDPASTVHSRMFAPAMGIPEDPATGAASGPLGAYLVTEGVLPASEEGLYSIRSEQGIEMGRPSLIDITVRSAGDAVQEVRIGGTAVIIGEGELRI